MTSTNHHMFCLKKHFIMNLLNNKNYLCKKIIWRKKQVAKHELIVLNAFSERVKILWKKQQQKPTVWTFYDIWQYKKEAWCIQRERLHEKVLWILTRRSNKTLTLKEKKRCH